MWQFISILNGLWVGGVFILKLDNHVAWGWWRTSLTAFAPMLTIWFLCLIAYLIDTHLVDDTNR